MLIRCMDCGSKSPFVTLPKTYFTPGGAIKFWAEHGHIPTLWTFKCECGDFFESGGIIARMHGWDDLTLAQNDYYFYMDHIEHGPDRTGRIIHA